MHVIGLVGFIGSGKNAVGEILTQKYGFFTDSFAAPLKDAVATIFGWSRDLLEGDTEESRQFRETKDEFWSQNLDCHFTPRLALQLMGTEAGRNVFGENLWSASAERRIIQREQNTVITDVRFPNEIATIRKLGGLVVWVKRGANPDWYDAALAYNNSLLKVNKPDAHYSEWAWIGQRIDAIIDNNGTFDDLQMNVASFYNLLTNTRY